METYTCTEYINLTNLNKIIKCKKVDDETITTLTRLKSHVKATGKHKVEFVVKDKRNRSKAIGRMYPKYSHPSLQGLKRDVRKALAYDSCVDLDIKNAHPVILNQILNQNDIYCDKLDYYVNHREDILSMYEDRDYGKERITSLINGGRPKEGHPDFEKLFYDDIMNATSKLFKLSKYEIYYKKGELDRPSNAQGHAVAFLAQDYERKCISSVIEKLRELEYEPSTIIHDGLLIHTKEVLADHTLEIQKYVKQQNHLEIELVVKPMNVFDEDRLWDEYTSGDGDETNDADEAQKFLEYMNDQGHHFIRSKNTIFWFNPQEGIWRITDIVDIRRYLIECDKIDTLYSKVAKKQDSLYTIFKSILPVDESFTEEAFKTTYQKLPFNNGIWDFKKSKLIPFSPEYRFFTKLKWDWGDLDENLVREIDDKVIYATFGKVRGDYYKDILSRAIAGEVYDKLFAVVIGLGNSGKGVNADLFNAFGEFAGTFNAGQLCKKQGVNDNAKGNSWLVSIANKRVAFCSEIPMGTPIDQGAIKTISSGGDPITGRQNYKDEMTFKLECTPFAFLNDMPEIKGSDDAIRNRMRYLETQYVYLSPEMYEIQKGNPAVRLADPNIKHEFVAREDVLRTFAIMICLNYKPRPPNTPPEVMTETKEWVSADDMTERLKDLFVITGNQDDFITSKQLNILANRSGIEVSSTKIGKLMSSIGLPNADKKVDGKTTKVYKGITIQVAETGDY